MQYPQSYVKVSSMDIVEDNDIYVETINVNEVAPIEGILYCLYPDVIQFCYELMKLQESDFVKACVKVFVFATTVITNIKNNIQI